MPTHQIPGDFLDFVKETCARNGIKLKIGRGKSVVMKPFGFRVLGYFDEGGSILACASGGSAQDFLSTLVHEFAHVLQWIEGDKTYKFCDHRKYGSVQNAVCMWINNEITLNNKILIRYTQKMIDCELNAERRAVKLIKEFNLPIDLDIYKSKASAVLYSYWVSIKTKKWDTKIGKKQMAASGRSLKRSFRSLPKNVERSFIGA
jgi:hypothetical protein